ncbi:MAG: winged helix-turn-helix transcriptional regulator [Thaumarchaeota archaeon]|nr:winged helix-turn-helix transcriptional regulator [Nitrososphaerota archaeon]
MPHISEITENSDKILQYVVDNPGAHLRQIQRALDIPLGTLRHHLEALEKNEKITSEKNILFRYYFATGFLIQNDRNALKILHNETAREILLHLLEKKTVHQNELVGNIGITAPSVNWHMQRLSSLGIASISKSGKHVVYELTADPSNIVKLLKNYYPKIWDKWSDRVSDMFLNFSEEPEE